LKIPADGKLLSLLGFLLTDRLDALPKPGNSGNLRITGKSCLIDRIDKTANRDPHPGD